MRRSRVLLPEPLGPMIVTTSPRFTEKSRPRSTWRWPYAFQASAQTTNGKPSLAAFRVAWTPARSTMSTGGAALQHADRVVPDGRKDRAHGLRQYNPAEGQEGPHSERRRGQRLVPTDREDPAPDHLAREGRLVQREPDDRCRHWGHHDPDSGERIKQEDQLKQDGGTAKQPDVEPRPDGEWLVRRQAQEGDDKTQHEAARHRGGSDLDRQPGAFQQEGEREVTKEIAQPIYCLRISTGMTRAGPIPFFFRRAFRVPFAWRASRASLTTLTSSSLPFLTATPILIPVLNANARSSVSRFCRTTSSTRTRSYIDRSVRSFRMARVVAGAFGYVVISIGGFPAATHFSL